MKRDVWGRELPSDYLPFWNRPLGRGSCILLGAVALSTVILPALSTPAESEPQSGSATRSSAPDGPRSLQFRNAIWGNRTRKPGYEFQSKDPRASVDSFLSGRMARNFGGDVTAIVKSRVPISAPLVADLAKAGATVVETLPLIDALTVTLPVSAINKVAELPWVSSISEDVVTSKLDEFTVESSMTGAALERYSLDGSGIGVAMLDSGVHSRPDIKGRVIKSVNFVPGDRTTGDPCGHGTHVAGIIAGDGKSSSGRRYFRTFYGIARNADIINVRVLDADGAGSVTTVIKGIEWVISHRARYNIRVMNLSVGHMVGESYKTDPLCLAVEKAWKAGIVVVCAAGNSGRINADPSAGLDNEGYGAAYGSIESPANSPYVITVGASKSSAEGDRTRDTIATYSSRGPSRLDYILKPDIVAPGNRVISLRAVNSTMDIRYGDTNAVPLSYYKKEGSEDDSSHYFRLSGTSMSAPVVSGAVALMLQKNPWLTPDTVKARLMISADKWADRDGRFDICSFGAGYLNVKAALESRVVAAQPAMSPTLYRDPAGAVVVDTDNVIWGSGGVWGIRGASRLNVIWGEYIPLQTFLPIGPVDNVIWGSNIIWGSGIWFDNVIWGSNSPTFISMNLLHGED